MEGWGLLLLSVPCEWLWSWCSTSSVIVLNSSNIFCSCQGLNTAMTVSSKCEGGGSVHRFHLVLNWQNLKWRESDLRSNPLHWKGFLLHRSRACYFCSMEREGRFGRQPNQNMFCTRFFIFVIICCWSLWYSTSLWFLVVELFTGLIPEKQLAKIFYDQ